MKAAGYTALVIPEKHGGLGADLEDFALCQEQLAQGCAATTIAINMHLFGIGSMVERATGRPQEELFFDVIGRGKQILGGGISEPETGGDWGYFATRARREGAGYILNGRKTFTSLSPVIDLFMVMATIEDFQITARGRRPSSYRAARPASNWSRPGTRWACARPASHDLLIKDVQVPAIAMAEIAPSRPLSTNTRFRCSHEFGISVAATSIPASRSPR